jgi:hypothetical protein
VEIEAELRSWRGKPLNRWQHKDKNHYNDTWSKNFYCASHLLYCERIYYFWVQSQLRQCISDHVAVWKYSSQVSSTDTV